MLIVPDTSSWHMNSISGPGRRSRRLTTKRLSLSVISSGVDRGRCLFENFPILRKVNSQNEAPDCECADPHQSGERLSIGNYLHVGRGEERPEDVKVGIAC